jgi:hypothetical protein
MIVFILLITISSFAAVDSFDPIDQMNDTNSCQEDDQIFKDCPDHVKERHNQAIKILDEAAAWVLSPIEELRKDEDIVKSFSDYFKIDIRNPNQEKMVNVVVAQVARLKQSAQSIKYSCKSTNKSSPSRRART